MYVHGLYEEVKVSDRVLIKCRESRNVEVGFIIHLYYLEMLDDLAVHINKLREHLDFEIVVSIPPEHESLNIAKRIVDKIDPIIIEGVDNKGRDVYPFLKTLHHLEPFKYACKIHTKNNKKEFNNYGSKAKCSMGPNPDNPYDSWRDDMWHSLMSFDKAIEAFKALKYDGVNAYAPDYLYLEPPKIDIVENADYIHQIGQIVGMELKSQKFIAGTMFWFKVESLLWLKDYNWDDKFDKMSGPTGQMEHAFERVFEQLAFKASLPEVKAELSPKLKETFDRKFKQTSIYTFMPYKEGNESFVDTCNRFMELLPNDDDFGIMIDHDAIFTTKNWHRQLEDAIKRYPDVNVFGAMTNRVYSPCLWADVDRENNDMSYHRERGKDIAQEFWDESFELPALDDKNKGLGGFFIMIRKSTWKRIGGFTCTLDGDDKCYGMDWALTYRLLNYGEKIHILKGVYMYHWYGNFNPEDYDKGLKREVDFSHHKLFNMMRIVVYTAIFGGKDVLLEPPIYENVDYVCFTDDPNMKSDIWDVRLVEPTNEDPCRAAKIYKILPHKYFPDHEVSLWLDGNIELMKSPHSIMHLLDRNNMAAFHHPSRFCIYKEAHRCLDSARFTKWNTDLIKEQMTKYEKEGYPENNGLINGGVLLRRHHYSSVAKTMEAWWQEIERYSQRDQLSFNYVSYKNDFRYTVISGKIYDNETQDIVSLSESHYH